MESTSLERKNVDFCIPKKKILTKEDLDAFQLSDAYKEFVGFILELNHSVIGKQTNEKIHVSEEISSLLKINQNLKDLVDEVKPEETGISRFGNIAFKTWYNKAKEIIPGLLTSVKIPKEAIQEVSVYLIESFGNATRLDYGTGHEDDLPAIVLRVFFDYIDLMRKIQFAYWLEPAGSHGVWGLDDYHFLPFLFGAAQLKGHKHFSPKCIHDSEIVDEFSKNYMYLACIKFVNTVKPSASLRWHSPMLDDISSVKTWDKVNEGMIKMYKVEVLGKLPIMQHFFLGSIISFDTGHIVPDDNCCGNTESNKENEHAHIYAFGQETPTCCGMRVPSAIGAAAFDKANTKKPDTPRPMRIPFD